MELLLFDVDGTLTQPRKRITSCMESILNIMKAKYMLGIVSGSDLNKIKEQLGDNIFDQCDYIFSENGLVAHKGKSLIGNQSIVDYLGDLNIKKFINFCLKYLSELDIPIKRGTFIELRKGLINISPIGRNCNQLERDEFEKYDKKEKIREKMITILKNKFKYLDLTYSIGGQISFDVFPKGWDKSYCLKYLTNHKIHFFGDKTEKGGNDHEIFVDNRVIGHAVKNCDETADFLNKLI